MPEDRRAHLLWPALSLEFTNTHERMLLSARVALVVEVVEQGRRGVELKQVRALIPGKPKPVGLCFAIGSHADLHCLCVFAQIFGLRPLAEQLPCSLAIEDSVPALSNSHVLNFTCCNV